MTEQPTFPAGTVVYLNSGSPPLTISDRPRMDGLVEVQWFDCAGSARRDAFHPARLSRGQNQEWAARYPEAAARAPAVRGDEIIDRSACPHGISYPTVCPDCYEGVRRFRQQPAPTSGIHD